MRTEPQAAPYRADTRIAAIAPWLADPVAAAAFPAHTLRFRNDRWANAVGLGDYAAGAKHRYQFAADLDATAGNEYQGDSSSARFVWDAAQK